MLRWSLDILAFLGAQTCRASKEGRSVEAPATQNRVLAKSTLGPVNLTVPRTSQVRKAATLQPTTLVNP